MQGRSNVSFSKFRRIPLMICHFHGNGINSVAANWSNGYVMARNNWFISHQIRHLISYNNAWHDIRINKQTLPWLSHLVLKRFVNVPKSPITFCTDLKSIFTWVNKRIILNLFFLNWKVDIEQRGSEKQIVSNRSLSILSVAFGSEIGSKSVSVFFPNQWFYPSHFQRQVFIPAHKHGSIIEMISVGRVFVVYHHFFSLLYINKFPCFSSFRLRYT